MTSKKIFLVILFLSLLLFTGNGCWDRREIDEITFVQSLGVDYVPDTDKFRISTITTRPQGGGQGGGMMGGGGGGAPQPTVLIVSEGKSFAAALQQKQVRSTRSLYFDHNEVIILGAEIAQRQGIGEILEYLVRCREFRLTSWFLITSTTAEEVLSATPEFENSITEEIIRLTITQSRQASIASGSNLKDFARDLSLPGIDPVAFQLKIIETKPEKNIPGFEAPKEHLKVPQLTGMSIFSGEYLAGFFEQAETTGFLIGTGRSVQPWIIIPDPKEKAEWVAIEKKRGNVKQKVTVKGKKIQVEIEVSAEGNLQSQTGTIDYADEEKIEILQKVTEEAIKEKIKKAISLAQEMQADIFGFGAEISRSSPSKWKKLESNWREIFPTVEVEVTVEFNIRRTGLTSTPLIPR